MECFMPCIALACDKRGKLGAHKYSMYLCSFLQLICVAGRENAPAQIIDEVITLGQWHHQFLQLAKVTVKSATYSGYSQ